MGKKGVGKKKKTEEKAQESVNDEKTEDSGDAQEKPAEDGEVQEDGKAKDGDTEETDKNKEDDGESSEEELPPGTLDGPVKILTTKRDRKSTEKFTTWKKDKEDENDQGKDAGKQLDYSKGKGTRLKDIPFIKYQIKEADTEDLVVLHRLMYHGYQGKTSKIKQNISDFCGYPFDKDTTYYKIAESYADRLVLAGVKFINGILGLVRSEDREAMRNDLLVFLMTPRDFKDLEVPSLPGKVKSLGTRKSNRQVPIKKNKTTSSHKVKKKATKDSKSEISDDSEEEEEEKPKRSAKKSQKIKKTVKIQAPASKGKSRASKRKSLPSDSSDDEPLIVTKRKKKPPTNAELKKAISSILKDADLGKVTMKSVMCQVKDKYSSFDLTSRKEFIKTTVKDVL